MCRKNFKWPPIVSRRPGRAAAPRETAILRPGDSPQIHTKRWLAAFAIGMVLLFIDGGDADRLGFLGFLAWLVAMTAGWVLGFRAIKLAFQTIVRRLSLRLAFSYFLIGIVPIPLLACLFLVVGYLFSLQFVGGRLRREIQSVAEAAAAGRPGARPVEVRDGKVSSSSLDWLPAGTPVPWASTPKSPKLSSPRIGRGSRRAR